MTKTAVSEASAGAFFEILVTLKKGSKRYSELKRTTEKSDKTVSENLKKAVDYRLVVKEPRKKDGDVFAVYSLTPKGNKFVREVLEWEGRLSK
ncbi:MAG: winged helix-turn-helix transcriptional regulator [Candidatus Diapherotrites archaeon]|nr:winged helix-turn-helix transcriptional regulator [Candidatus Diapherotrites archaeon]